MYESEILAMEHVIYLDDDVTELNDLLSGRKSMIIQSSHDFWNDYKEVVVGDTLYFMIEDGGGHVEARGMAIDVIKTENLSKKEEIVDLILHHQDKLQLTVSQLKKWVRTHFLTLIEVSGVEEMSGYYLKSNTLEKTKNWLQITEIEYLRK